MKNDQSESNQAKNGESPLHLGLLQSLIQRLPSFLMAYSEDEVSLKNDSSWSKKQELGHLIDSAANNHQRIVRAHLEAQPSLPSYDGDAWVELHRYQERDWIELIRLWQSANQQLLAAAKAVSGSAWSRTCTVGDSESLMLSFVFDDYVNHMIGHLRHIAGVPKGEIFDLETLYPEKPATADHPIDVLIGRRWSPRLFDEKRAVERASQMTLLEAARWAPSCFNEQPWRYLVFDQSDLEALERARDCLVEGNAWARKAPLLMISVARETFTQNDKPNRTAPHDVGLASENLVLQAIASGLAAHQMAGFDLVRARSEFEIPAGFTPIAMIAIGYPYRGNLEGLPEKTRSKELAPRSRKPISEIAYAGKWGVPLK
jgi:nitroreductase